VLNTSIDNVTAEEIDPMEEEGDPEEPGEGGSDSEGDDGEGSKQTLTSAPAKTGKGLQTAVPAKGNAKGGPGARQSLKGANTSQMKQIATPAKPQA